MSDLSPLRDLINLETLDVRYTRVSDLSSLKDLQNLQNLYLSASKISDLSSLIYLKKIQHLRAHSTRICDLTPLHALGDLQLIDISRTLVADLSPVLPLIKKGVPVKWESHGEGILVKGCPFTNPPPEIVQQGNDTILRYFDEREKAGTDQIYEAKLLLIGEGGAGKTTLCRKLFDTTAELPKEQDSTRGIDIKPLYFDIANGKQFRLNIWDFAPAANLRAGDGCPG